MCFYMLYIWSHMSILYAFRTCCSCSYSSASGLLITVTFGRCASPDEILGPICAEPRGLVHFIWSFYDAAADGETLKVHKRTDVNMSTDDLLSLSLYLQAASICLSTFMWLRSQSCTVIFFLRLKKQVYFNTASFKWMQVHYTHVH